jgi:hypothetical protein
MCPQNNEPDNGQANYRNEHNYPVFQYGAAAVSDDVFNKTKSEYGWCSSWAFWSLGSDTGRPKSGISDLAIFDQEGILYILHVDYIVIGLKISRKVAVPPLANFYSPSPTGQDFKLRFALKGTPVWGAYMTAEEWAWH